MDEGNLLRMNRGLAAESHRQYPAGFVNQAVGIAEVDMRHVPSLQARSPGGIHQPAACRQQAVPAELCAEFRGQVSAAQHQRAELATCAGDRQPVLDAMWGLDQRGNGVELPACPSLDTL